VLKQTEDKIWGLADKKIPLMGSITKYVVPLYYPFIGEFAISRVLTHLVPYLKIQRILVNELTSMTPKSKNTCRMQKAESLSFQTVLGLECRGQSLINEISIRAQSLRS